jgi:hypothetical protein
MSFSVTAKYGYVSYSKLQITYWMFTFYLVYPNNSIVQGLGDGILLTSSADRSYYLLRRLKRPTTIQGDIVTPPMMSVRIYP